MKIRIFGLVMAVALLFCSFAMAATVSAAETVTITVGSVSGKVGDVVEVPISISANSYLVNADMFVTFDPAKLELATDHYADPNGDDGDTAAYKVNTAVLGSSWMYAGNEKTPGKFMFVAATGTDKGITAEGEMFRLAFKILSEDAQGAQITFSASPICGSNGSTATGSDGMRYPVDYDITYTVVSGTVTVEEEPQLTLGDADASGSVDIMDVMAIYAHVSGELVLTGDQLAVADFDASGSVDIMDVMTLYAVVSGTV